jgi:putative two-component system response regulator
LSVLAPAVLVVEDDLTLQETLTSHLASLGYRVAGAASAEEALAWLDARIPDLVVTDVHMGTMSGIELCARIKADRRFQLVPVILVTAVSDLDARVAGLAAGADDFFAKPFDPVELKTRVAALLRVKALVDELEHAETVITTLGSTIEARDPYTGGHCQRLAGYAMAVGQAMGIDPRGLKALRLGGYLHDLGKVAIPDVVLLKPGPLDAAERSRIEAHPGLGADLVGSLRTLEDVRPLIRHHHERWDGTGYPDGLKGEAIPLGARIMAVVDVYDALRTRRPYKGALGGEDAIAILIREAEAGCWDPAVVSAALPIFRDFPDQSA